MREITLANGRGVALVDDEDYDLVSRYRWYLNTGYAMTAKSGGALMHILIMNPPTGMQVDHINRNGLDNQRSNLRFCTQAENTRNRPGLGGASRFKGVYLHHGKWVAQITYDYKQQHLGCYDSEEDAAIVYDRAARQYHGEFAFTNFPDDDGRRIHRVIKDYGKVSRYPGVGFNKGRSKPWMSRITINGKLVYLGSFATEEEAYEAYLQALNGQ